MSSQWQNFLRNLGEWRGSFTSFDPSGQLLGTSRSLLNLDASEDRSVVHFRLRRYAEDSSTEEPLQDSRQEVRSLGRQAVFFPSGAFSKGSLQVSPVTAFGAEYGFVSADRRLRLVQLFCEAGGFERLVLIREFRSGSDAAEGPPLTLEQLAGRWQGEALTVSADWPEPSAVSGTTSVRLMDGGQVEIHTAYGPFQALQSGRREGDLLHLDGGGSVRMQLLPDGASSTVPELVSHRSAFSVEAGWLPSPGRRERLIRRYNERGEWVASLHLTETRQDD